MIDDIEKLAAVLETEGLEPETSKLINTTLREMLQDYRTKRGQPLQLDGNNTIISQTVFNEWVNGQQPAERGED